jgi:hypothetical protein
MGAATLYVGLAYEAMPASTGWQANIAADLQSYGQAATDALSWIPGWAAAVALLVVVALLARRALRQLGPAPDDEGQVSKDESSKDESSKDESEAKEEIVEYRDA